METSKKPSLMRRAGMFVGTALVIGLAVGAVSVGSDALAERVENAPQPNPAPLASVAVTPVAFQDHYTTTRRFLGQIEATATVNLSFELGGHLAELTVDEGESIAQGDLIARLDTAFLEAERDGLVASKNATQAQLTFAQSRLNRAERLQGEGFSSRETLDQARATRDELANRISEINAGLARIDINIEKSVLRAPFDGRIGTLAVETKETVSAGQMVLQMMQTAQPKFRVGLPLSLSEDELQKVALIVADQRHTARLEQLRPDIDPITRTRTALFTLETDQALAFGQTAYLVVQTKVAARGAWVALDALQQGSGSLWSVLTVDDGTVRPAAVEVLYQHSDRAFVQGSFAEGAQLIRTGAHRVVPGQQVQILTSGS